MRESVTILSKENDINGGKGDLIFKGPVPEVIISILLVIRNSRLVSQDLFGNGPIRGAKA